VRTHRGRDRGYAIAPPRPNAAKRERVLAYLGKLGEGETRWASEIARGIGLQPCGDHVSVVLRDLEREGIVVRHAARGRDLWRLKTATAVGGVA
jgi:hypothetical protein